MNRNTDVDQANDLRDDYDVAQLQGGVQGKHYRRYADGTNLVRLDPDVVAAFPSVEAVNTALRLLIQVAKATGAAAPR